DGAADADASAAANRAAARPAARDLRERLFADVVADAASAARAAARYGPDRPEEQAEHRQAAHEASAVPATFRGLHRAVSLFKACMPPLKASLQARDAEPDVRGYSGARLAAAARAQDEQRHARRDADAADREPDDAERLRAPRVVVELRHLF